MMNKDKCSPMKEPMTPTKTPFMQAANNDEGSPGAFVKPADLFKMRRRTSTNLMSSFINNSNIQASSSSSSLANHGLTMRSSPLKFSNINNNALAQNRFLNSPTNFSNHSSTSISYMEPQSPLKCLSNHADPSPTKCLPNLLKNPFNKPVKRRLNLGYSPKKRILSPKKSGQSPLKKIRMFEIDEDANQEPPRMKPTNLSKHKSCDSCSQVDWSLKTKLRINFDTFCKNWNHTSTSTHRRSHHIEIEQSSNKQDDKSISLEAINNASTVYQHPYLSWLSLYPRVNQDYGRQKDKDLLIDLTKHPKAAETLHMDWCKSLDDLSNLLIGGSCPYFYMCSDIYNILFRSTPSSDSKRPLVQAFVAPFPYGLSLELTKIGVEFNYPDTLLGTDISPAPSSTLNSQNSFGSFKAGTSIDSVDTPNKQSLIENKVSSSIDSGKGDDIEDFGEDENEEASVILVELGVDIDIITKKKGFIEDSNTQFKSSTSNKPIAAIVGADNVRKLVKFLQISRMYTISNVGKFGCIPPTLLSPREFRLSTAQNPKVVLSKNMIEMVAEHKEKQQGQNQHVEEKDGPTFVEIRGTILPVVYKQLHELLKTTDNLDNHSCTSTVLETSQPFATL